VIICKKLKDFIFHEVPWDGYTGSNVPPATTMTDYTFDQLVDIQQVRQLLESHHRISGMACGLMDTDGTIIVAAGLQEICTRFHWDNPESFARCWRNDRDTREKLHSFEGDMYEYRCQNGMVNIAMPIVAGDTHIATFFTGQFFYDNTPPDREYFIAQAEELGFDRDEYLDALDRMPLFSREHVRDNLRFLHNMVQVIAEMGLNKFKLVREMEERKRIEHQLVMLDHALNNSRDAVYLIDDHLRFIYVNDVACRVLGYTRDELLAMRIPDIDPDLPAEALSQMMQNTRAIGANSIETRHRTRDGRIFPVEVTGSMFEFEGRCYNLALARDITERKQVEQQLELLNHALDRVREGAFLTDEHGRFLYVNQEACRSLEYSRDELLTMAVPDIDPSFSADRVVEHVADKRKQGTLTFETQHRTRSCRLFPVEITSSLLEYGGVSYVLSLVRNITERKRVEEMLREREREFRTLAENSPDNIARYDTMCRVVYANTCLGRTLGMSADCWLGKTVMEIFPNGEYGVYQERIAQVLESGEEASIDLVIPDAGEGERYHNIRFVAERGADGGVTGVLAIGRDITEQKRASENLHQLNESLENRVRSRTAELEEANARLQELDRMKSMFIASMSHELRTPLNSAIGFSRILFNEWAGPLSEEQKENLATILKSCKHLLSLINDVIDVSKIEAGMIEAFPEEFDIYDVVADAVTSCENAICNKGVDLKVQAIHHTMHTDRTRLLQCLLNLVSNAVKYTEKGIITINAEAADGGSALEISVTDTGIGIPDEDMGKLFSPFVRLESPHAATIPGTGLGLYLTRKLIREVLQGDITVTSAAGVGSRFVLTVPIKEIP
jgi:PAS domain S-box-containing protein